MKRILLSVVLVCAAVQTASAHFIWIIPGTGPSDVRVVFSDALEPDDAVSIDKIAKVKLWLRDGTGKSTPTTHTKGEHCLNVKVPAEGTVVVAGTQAYGVLQKGDAKPFLLAYHPKFVRGDVKAATAQTDLPVEIVAQGQGRFRVLFGGKPAPKADVVILTPGDKKETATSDDKGEFTVKSQAPGIYGIRARHIDPTAGEQAGKKYDEVKHYATLVYEHPKASAGTR